MFRFFVVYLFFLLVFFLLNFISHTAYSMDYLHHNILFFAEKVLLAKFGEPPRLENIGFVYPPLAFLPFWFINDYVAVSPLISALVLTFFLFFLTSRCQNAAYFIIFFLLLNPLVLFIAVYRFEVLSFYLLLSFSVIMLVLHMEKGYSIYLFGSGLLFGLCFFLDFRSLFLIPLFAFVIYLSTKEKDLGYRLAILIVKFSPIIFFFFAWLYLNWIFTEDPLTFIKSPYSFFKSEPLDTKLIFAKGHLFESLKYVIEKFIKYLPIILPYFLVLFNLKRYRFLYLVPVYLIYLSPVVLVYFAVYFSTFFPAYYYTVLFLIFALGFQVSFGIKSSKLLALCFVVSLLSSWILPLYSKEENEKNFVKFLVTREIEKNLEEDKKVAKILKEENCEKILIDDAGSFPVIVFVGEPRRFYLPYMYEYYSVLTSPEVFADCLVVNKTNPANKLNMRFPYASMGFLEGYFLIYDGRKYNVFKR